jgi:3-methylfumaryl-CoA hydratase
VALRKGLSTEASMNGEELATLTGRGDGWEEITVPPLQSLGATLDHAPAEWHAGDALPAGWQWLYFLPLTPQARLDADGRSTRDAALTRGTGSKRMFAGARMKLHRPLCVGDRVFRESMLLERTEKQGRSGRLLFMTTRYTYRDERGPALEEEQDIVFREAAASDGAMDRPADVPSGRWGRTVTPDAVMLFRFSALTFNGHRIHYDLPYAQREGYPGLVVHGPLLAILLLDLAARHATRRRVAEFSFRARAPVFVDTPVSLRGEADRNGATALLSACRHDGVVAMTATIRFAEGNAGTPLSRP